MKGICLVLFLMWHDGLDMSLLTRHVTSQRTQQLYRSKPAYHPTTLCFVTLSPYSNCRFTCV